MPFRHKFKDYRTLMRWGHVTAARFSLYYNKTFAQEDMEPFEITVMTVVGYKTLNMRVG